MYLILARNPVLLVLSATKFSMLRNVYYITFNHSHKKMETVWAYFKHLMRAVPARIASLEFPWVFFYAKNFKLACYIWGFHLRISLNFLKYVSFCACMPGLSEI